jgi:hypothetical protein
VGGSARWWDQTHKRAILHLADTSPHSVSRLPNGATWVLSTTQYGGDSVHNNKSYREINGPDIYTLCNWSKYRYPWASHINTCHHPVSPRSYAQTASSSNTNLDKHCNNIGVVASASIKQPIIRKTSDHVTTTAMQQT